MSKKELREIIKRINKIKINSKAVYNPEAKNWDSAVRNCIEIITDYFENQENE